MSVLRTLRQSVARSFHVENSRDLWSVERTCICTAAAAAAAAAPVKHSAAAFFSRANSMLPCDEALVGVKHSYVY